MHAAQRAPVVLIIRDGWGENPHPEHDAFNAVRIADTPVADRLAIAWPTTLIRTSGEDVGLPPGTMGNSEVGHQNIGAGRIVPQAQRHIARAIEDGSFFANEALRGAIAHLAGGGSLHLLGLLSDGRVHSDLPHLEALLDMAGREAVPPDRLFVHVITDGRDVGPTTGLGFVDRLEAKLRASGLGRIATVSGRHWTMDRDHRWERVARAYRAMTGRAVAHRDLPEAPVPTAATAAEAVQAAYDAADPEPGVGDEFIAPTRIVPQGTEAGEGLIADGDAIVLFNFRGDRPREIVGALVLDDDAWLSVAGGGFDRGARLEGCFVCTMTNYEAELPVGAVAFERPPPMEGTLGAVVSGAGQGQFRCAETEKFPHVTYFLNDYREAPWPGERRSMPPSPRDVPTYDRRPAMSAEAVRDAVLERLAADEPDALLVVNFANPDMVGHTGNLEAAVRAVEVVDACTGAIVEATLALEGSLVVTADHGNAEQMLDPGTGSPHTNHTIYDVPLHLVSSEHRGAVLRDDGRLADLAPTLLGLLGLSPPPAMTGRSLVE